MRARLAVAPLRVSLAGGGTDLPSYADRYGGLVVSFAIDRCVAVTAFPREFSGRTRSRFGEADLVEDAAFGNPLAATLLERHNARGGLQLSSLSDIPAGSGLGSSAAFAVATVGALDGNGTADSVTIAELAAAAEIESLGRPVGKHDHYVSALGGMQHLMIEDGVVSPQSLPVLPSVRKYLDECLLLFYIGSVRDAGNILTAQDHATRESDEGTLRSLHGIRALVPRLLSALQAGAVEEIGPLLDEHWRQKVRLSAGVGSPQVAAAYERALAAGADGGKVVGAGGGGFFLVSARPECQAAVRQVFQEHGMREFEFRFRVQGVQVTGLDL